MPRTLFTTTTRAQLRIAEILSGAVVVSRGKARDVYEAGQCRITCRYWTQGGDFVSKQVLGCATAVRSGELKCVDIEKVEQQIYETQTVIGVVGPEDAVQRVVSQIARQCDGVIVDGNAAAMA